MLRGQAKKDYQREYMKAYMAKRRVKTPQDVKTLLRPMLDPPKILRPFVRPYSKEEQLGIKMSKRQAEKELTFAELKARYDVRKK